MKSLPQFFAMEDTIYTDDLTIEQVADMVMREEARSYCCGAVQITASDMGVLLYIDFGFVKNGNFMQYKL